ncbi:putative reductase [Actinacidiphila reveromycinica]|uniref:Putative reductase n=1 Tax=Actinacidiphila reveromycinica TaxID=659352 RepID=A0A7U3VSI4_9ACTN|nr:NAD-dependent epimerase/dehydratase family protein [Streptomyces sp. SN-593]BBB01916.1 putative reductase [Streptomyces sp. SN-593]
MRSVLVLGGTVFVGRALVDAAVGRGWRVSAFTNEPDPVLPPAVEHLLGDRTDPRTLDVLRGREWDCVVDTWAGRAEAVRDTVALLRDTVGRYGYVSTLMAHQWPVAERPLRESSPLRPASPGGRTEGYPARKAAGERAVAEGFGDRAVVARPGLVLGPHERPGRLPRWLLRHRAAGPGEALLAPGRPGRRIQYVDARDLAGWLLDALEGAVAGAYNLACPAGHATMGGLMEACAEATGSAARPEWVPEPWLLSAGARSWTELPVWVPEEGDGAALYDLDVSAALSAGFTPRPLAETVADTWDWLAGVAPGDLDRAVRRADWITPEREAALLEGWAADRARSPRAS